MCYNYYANKSIYCAIWIVSYIITLGRRFVKCFFYLSKKRAPQNGARFCITLCSKSYREIAEAHTAGNALGKSHTTHLQRRKNNTQTGMVHTHYLICKTKRLVL